MKWDINLDAGELIEHIKDGTEVRLYNKVARINIACGGHAGDEHTMNYCLTAAKKLGVIVGAHPSYPDLKSFGRESLPATFEEVRDFVKEQVKTLNELARAIGLPLNHVKPHGALYHDVSNNLRLAEAVAQGVADVNKNLFLVGMAGTSVLLRWRELGFKVLAEGFADRAYRSNGTLLGRKEQGAVINDATAAAKQAKDILLNKQVKSVTGEWISIECDTVCVHGDNPAAENILEILARDKKGNSLI